MLRGHPSGPAPSAGGARGLGSPRCSGAAGTRAVTFPGRCGQGTRARLAARTGCSRAPRVPMDVSGWGGHSALCCCRSRRQGPGSASLPPPPPSGLAPVSDLGFKERAAATAPAQSIPGEEAEVRQRLWGCAGGQGGWGAGSASTAVSGGFRAPLGAGLGTEAQPHTGASPSSSGAPGRDKAPLCRCGHHSAHQWPLYARWPPGPAVPAAVALCEATGSHQVPQGQGGRGWAWGGGRASR